MGLITLRKSGLVALGGGRNELHHRPNAPVVLDFFQRKNRKVIRRPFDWPSPLAEDRDSSATASLRLGDLCDSVPWQTMRDLRLLPPL